MIEIMVAIGIILVLMAIGVFGFRYLDKASSSKATNVALANCESMVAEYESSMGPGSVTTLPNATAGATGSGDVAPGSTARQSAVDSTKLVIQALMRNPKNKTFFAGLPAKGMVDLNGTRQQVLADGWGNPIIFVGRAGMSTSLGKKPDGSFSKTGVSVTNPSGRPFWASAGPDGNFDAGDDNIYSFEK